MSHLVHYVIVYGVPLIVLNVFLEQIGAPVPAVPTLIIAGALSRDGKISSTHVIAGAVIACELADFFGVNGIEVSERDILHGAALAAAELPEHDEGAAPPGAYTCC